MRCPSMNSEIDGISQKQLDVHSRIRGLWRLLKVGDDLCIHCVIMLKITRFYVMFVFNYFP